ncbi:MAG: DUF1573 domain-containing protein [Candidatus Zixiibacteriota bacterium]|nr:MAG: DUF1573 domain-containing protein [candidate division Zixibacteria bacterium]
MKQISKPPFTIAGIVLAFMVITGSALGGPAIKLVESGFDFGKTIQHVKVTHDFWIKSIGDQPLVITKVVPGCGCTEIPLRDSVLAPGDSTVLSITFSTKSFARKITKRPYLLTNISDQRVQLVIKAEVVIEPEQMAPLKITPFEIDVSASGRAEHRHAVFLIENQGDQDVRLKVIDEPEELVETTLPAVVKSGETAEGIVVVKKEAAGMEFEKSVTIELNDANHTRYSLPVSRLNPSSAGGGK